MVMQQRWLMCLCSVSLLLYDVFIVYVTCLRGSWHVAQVCACRSGQCRQRFAPLTQSVLPSLLQWMLIAKRKRFSVFFGRMRYTPRVWMDDHIAVHACLYVLMWAYHNMCIRLATIVLCLFWVYVMTFMSLYMIPCVFCVRLMHFHMFNIDVIACVRLLPVRV